MAVQKLIWNTAWCLVRASTTLRISTENTMPALPAARVSATLSQMICERMSRGTAPMARRMPISTVRSRTVTIMMLLTPTAPASSVPMPTSQIRKFTPRNRLSTMLNICSVLSTITAWSSVGSKRCSRDRMLRIRPSSVLIFTPFLPVMQMMSTLLPRL